MAGLRNLMILGVMLIGVVVGVEGVTDEQFQELSNLVRRLQDENERQSRKLTELTNKNADQDVLIEKLLEDKREETILKKNTDPSYADLAQNTTIEERVALLELQVGEIQGAIALLLENDDFLFDEQVIQDERLFSLETETEQIEEEVEILQDTTQELNFRVTILEEGGGSDGNSSIGELEERVETLEGTAADHETRITAAEAEIEDLEGTTDDHETRLTSAEENIQGLQMTDISLDARITALEENGGGGSSGNATIAFHTGLTEPLTISEGSTVVFNDVLLNVGDGYDDTTGVFTVPSKGSGLYYFSTYILVDNGEYARFDMRVNDENICQVYGDHDDPDISDYPQVMCSGVAEVVEGDEIKVVYNTGSDTTPLAYSSLSPLSGFNGFRI